jgi:hypothetical protein
MTSALLLLILQAAPPSPPPVCRSAKHCAFVAREAMLDRDLPRAEKAAIAQLHFEECTERPHAALETLARIALQRGQPLLAQAWLSDSGGGADVRREVTAAVAALPPAAGVGGSYRSYQQAGLWDTVDVKTLADGRVHFALSAVRLSGRRCADMQGYAAGDHSYVIAAQGGLEGDAARRGEDFVYESREYVEADQPPCVIRLRFSGDSLTVTQDGRDVHCGFGAGVDASGDYVRTSR